MIDETDDARLVALIDNQLDDATRQTMHTRLMVEPELRARYQQLAAGGLPFRLAFEAALADAPLARMRARLGPLDSDAARARPQLRRIAAAAAAVALAFFAVGWTIGRFAPGSIAPAEREDWREAVAGYASLYTKETFVGLDGPPDPAALARLSQAVGVTVTAASIALPGLSFKWAGVLAYDGAPLGEIAYLDGGDPVVFCIIRNGEKDGPVQTDAREGVAVASWARGGRGFLVGGRISKQRATELAAALGARF